MNNDEKPFIWIKKIVRVKNSDSFTIEDEVLKKIDVKGIRRWHRNDKDSGIRGDIVLVTIERTCGFPAVSIKVNESLESISKRLGNVHTVEG